MNKQIVHELPTHALFINLTGHKYGLLTVKSYAGKKSNAHQWRCICDCGGERTTSSGALRQGLTRSCGCIGKRVNLENLTGHVFGRLTVIGNPETNGRTTWECLCECGAKTRKLASLLKNGSTVSCGCKKSDKAFKSKHGVRKSKHPLYRIWASMKERCLCETHHAYHRYGGRGITVCAGLNNSFEHFLTTMGERPEGYSIDRDNNDLGYWCGGCGECNNKGRSKNVKWQTKRKQAQNRSDNVLNEKTAKKIQSLYDGGISIAEIRGYLSLQGVSHDTVKNAAVRHTWSDSSP